MSHEPNRQPEGIPTGGQYAAKIKSDNVPSLGAATRRPELEGWPESAPEPEFSVHVDDANVVTTSVSINGEPAFEFWNPGDDVHSLESSDFETDALADEADFEAAKAWAADKHTEVADALRAEMLAAVERSRARIMAKATGVPVPQSDEDLEKIVDASFATYNAVQRDGELASTALTPAAC
jgi:hypothetical protein